MFFTTLVLPWPNEPGLMFLCARLVVVAVIFLVPWADLQGGRVNGLGVATTTAARNAHLPLDFDFSTLWPVQARSTWVPGRRSRNAS